MKRGLPSLILTLHHTPARWSLSATATGVPGLRRLFQDLLLEGYRFASLEAHSPAGLPQGAISVTVDDGYESNARHLAPLLRELRIPWTVFVLEGSLGRQNGWDLRLAGPRERHLTEDDIRALAGEGVTIGAHGATHRDLRHLDDIALEEELAGSRTRLRRLCGQEVALVSYPRGRVDARVARAAERAGFRSGFCGARPPRLDTELSRFAIARTALYSPDQVPGVFTRTALRPPQHLASIRPALAGLGDALTLAGLKISGLKVQGGRHV